MFWNLSTWPVLETHQLHAFLPLVTQRGGRIRNGRCKNAHFIQPLESRSKTSHRGVYCVFFLQRTPVPLSCDKKHEQNPAVTAYMKRSISLVEKSCLNTCSLHLRRRRKKKKKTTAGNQYSWNWTDLPLASIQSRDSVSLHGVGGRCLPERGPPSI